MITIAAPPRLVLSFVLAAAAGAAALTAGPAPARAQGITGAVRGRTTDASSGDPLGGVTVVVTARGVTQTAISEDDGSYQVTGLAPGPALVTFFFGDVTVERRVRIGPGRTTPVFQAIRIEIAARYDLQDHYEPEIDPNSTAPTTTIDRTTMSSLAIPGRGFMSALGITPGSQDDGVGPAFSGSSAPESRYYVDGVPTTGLRYGTAGASVLNNFIEEIEVITGGYNAEHGRSTGAVVNVVTVTGDNTLRGEAFATVRPGALVAATRPTPHEGSSIDVTADLALSTDAGGWLAGPLIRDRLWFAVGLAPSYRATTLTRTTGRRRDCQQLLPSGALSGCDPRPVSQGGHADGVADVDPDTGFVVIEELAARRRSATDAGLQGFAKLNYAYRPEHQGQLTVNFDRGRRFTPELFGLPESGDHDADTLTSELAAKWSSKFDDGKTEVDAVLGWHREGVRLTPRGAAATAPFERLLFGNLGTWSRLGYEDAATAAGCDDNQGDDRYPFIENCPDAVGHGYHVGGFGPVVDNRANRWAARLDLTRRLRLAGQHELKWGLDVEDNRLDEPRAYTGAAFYENFQDRAEIHRTRWIEAGPAGTSDPRYDRTCSYSPDGGMAIDLPCRYIGQTGEGALVSGETIDWAGYLRDSWHLRPNLTVNAGLRYEEQRLRFAEHLRDALDPLTGQRYGTDAMVLRGMWAPRIGALYDWTREGRSKLYGHWGRFYESIPMDINARSFAGEVSYRQVYDYRDCGDPIDGYGGPSGAGCPDTGSGGGDLLGINGSLVAPGIRPQYLDEQLAGVEYMIMEDLRLGISYQHRALGRVIEDLSTDGAATYVIANPGEWSDAEEARLQARIDAAGDPAEQARLEGLMRQFRGIRAFDKPRRDYHALQFTLSRRFSRSLYLQASYTYSRNRGNFPGLVSYDNGQLDPNISSQYDLIELLANREGPLPLDRPHYLKLDTFYKLDLKRAGTVTTGVRLRALSGVPRDVLARHARYGPGESFLLPRGQIGRTRFETGVDLHLGYARKLRHGMELELFVDLFDLLDDQGVAAVEEQYSTRSASNPIVGGGYHDLIWAKENDLASGLETANPIRRNPNFGNPIRRYPPRSTQLGATLRF